LAVEYGGTIRPRTKTKPAAGLTLINLRLGRRHPTEPSLGFITAGVVAGRSTNYAISPMIGAGVILVPRTPYSRRREYAGGLRLEAQVCTRGKNLVDRGRVMFGFSFPIP
jgi:hypothetical protein